MRLELDDYTGVQPGTEEMYRPFTSEQGESVQVQVDGSTIRLASDTRFKLHRCGGGACLEHHLLWFWRSVANDEGGGIEWWHDVSTGKIHPICGGEVDMTLVLGYEAPKTWSDSGCRNDDQTRLTLVRTDSVGALISILQDRRFTGSATDVTGMSIAVSDGKEVHWEFPSTCNYGTTLSDTTIGRADVQVRVSVASSSALHVAG